MTWEFHQRWTPTKMCLTESCVSDLRKGKERTREREEEEEERGEEEEEEGERRGEERPGGT